MKKDQIEIRGAHQNNLKNINIDLPKYKWITFTGVSGSGKSTMVYDVIYSQAQKEYLESLSAYARRSFPKIQNANVEQINNLSPCIVLDQSGFPNTPRSTVGTYTDIYTYIRLLFSRAGNVELPSTAFSFNDAQGACEMCGGLGEALTPNLSKLIDKNLSLNEGAIKHKTWKVGSRYWNIIRAIERFDMDKKLKDFSEEEMDHLLYSPPYVYQNNEPGHVQSFSYEGIISRLRKRKTDSRGLSSIEYDAQFFSNGVCPKCCGARLNERALNVKIAGKYTISQIVNMEIQELYKILNMIHGPVEDTIIKLITKGLKNIIDVGMGYITLNRSSYSLSNGEAQKIKLAKQLGCSLTDLIYILDEPSAGLHARDIYKMKDIIRNLVEKGNTALVIEHNRSMISESNYIVDMGPGAGKNGGEILYFGEVDGITSDENSITGKYLAIDVVKLKDKVRVPNSFFYIDDINRNNVHHLNLKIPKNVFFCISGVSGAGKSTVLDSIIEHYPNAIVVDQNLVGANVRSNAMTYTKIFNDIREFFSKHTGKDESDFSFNSNGSCPCCKGLGYLVTDMHFIGDIRTVCEECNGKRYKKNILECYINEKNISDVLDMTIEEAIKYFNGENKICKNLQLLCDVGLDYITLGQPLSTFSGGELQRLKLASKISSKGEIYIFDEPTHGLHFKDTERLLKVMNNLVEQGNTVIVVEHNLEVIAQADYVIDMGPLGGKDGGKILFEGTPRELCNCNKSYTAEFLKKEITY